MPSAVSPPAHVQNTSGAEPIATPAQPQNAPQVDPVSLPAQRADAPGPAAGASPSFQDVVREVVRDVVLSLSPKPSAVALAQTQAAILHWNATLTATLFYGQEPVPVAAAGEVTLLYVGRLAPLSAATLEKYPHLKTDPPFEVAPLVVESGISRDAVVAELAQDFTGFGAAKVPAQVEQPAAGVLQLRCTLRAGRYGLACGVHYFELAVQ